MRTIVHFNDNWRFHRPGEEPVDVTLPHTWNAVDGQDGGNDYWRGTAVYTKSFVRPEADSSDQIWISFKGAAMTCDVELNGVKIAHHEGGYSAFRAEMTEYLRDENTIRVFVDNSRNESVYPQMADFTFYGGLYRDVELIIVPAAHFELQKDGTPGIKVTPVVDLEARSAQVMIETWQCGTNGIHRIEVEIPTEHGSVYRRIENVTPHSVTNVLLSNVHLWDGLEDPYLYTVNVRLVEAGGKVLDEVSTRFGCRTYCIDPQKGFFLNGRSYPLRGVSRHQDRAGIGNALTYKEHAEDMDVALEIGANTLRLAHYQHADEFYDLCDEKGMVVWAEIPYITKHMSGGKQNAVDQMRELITQTYNHPSIICWGLSNEITAASPVDDELLDDHRALNDLCHEMDSTRPTVMAHAFMLEKDSPLIPIADLASYNLYFGWYLGTAEMNDQFFDEYHEMFPDRVIGFSEYGADANAKFHSDHPEQGDYTEEYQCLYHEHIIKCIEERPYLWATHVWNLFDFAADGRDEGGKHGQNQKGLVEFDHKTKKDAFYLYKAAWSKKPFVHLCGKRYTDRCGDHTQIKVYSNLKEVTLLVDGSEFGTLQGEKVFCFDVPISAEHKIEAVCRCAEVGTASDAASKHSTSLTASQGSGATCMELRDTMTIRKVEQENPEYRFGGAGNVENWFDKVEIDPAYFSIKDLHGDLMKDPAAAAIVEQAMEIFRSSRGEVAESTKNNKNLQKMMAQMMATMSFDRLLKLAGGELVTPELIRSINEALQKIKKSCL